MTVPGPSSLSCSQCSFSTPKERKMTKHMLKHHPVIENGGISKKKKKLSKNKELTKDCIKAEFTDLISADSEVESTPTLHQISAEADVQSIPTPQQNTMSTTEDTTTDADAPGTVLSCPFCKSGEEFSSLGAISAHKRSEHNDIALNCCLCDFSTFKIKKWHKHLKKAHSQVIDPLLDFLKIHIQQEGVQKTEM